ncbi:MAG: polyprenyl diphosphate synthase [Candidatus Magasanikbacteria bacterium]
MSENSIQHLAIIMDGNRRWATTQNLPKFVGHTEGAKNLKRIVKHVRSKNIPYLTLYTLSTENLKREKKELEHLFSLFGKLINYISDFTKHDTQLRLAGDISQLPENTRKALLNIVEKTKNHSSLVLTLAVAYGGRDEIVRAAKKIITKKISADTLEENIFEENMDFAGYPNVDLVIRTGEKRRLSNFMLWKIAYAELYFTDTHWPAFSEKNLDEALDSYYKQKRTFGK